QPPTESFVQVRPNRYEPGRANIIVYNWSHQQSVAVDLSRVLQLGQAYEVRNAQDFFGPPIVSGSYEGGAIELPLDESPATPSITGMSIATTGIEFATFVVLPK